MDGKPVTIARLKDNKLLFDQEALSSILKRVDYSHEDIAVISVAGAFRQGKSFLLNFMLRYLENEGKPGWMGKEGEPLKGFSWRNGCEKHSTGIVVWSKLFPVKINSDYEIYVMLMDTEGLYGYTSSIDNNASIFALSTLLSSVQIFNVSQNIQENDLMYLEIFSEYGKRASQMGVGIPFQKLMFLVRDWSYPYDFHYGYKDGEEFVNRCLAIREVQHKDHKSMRKNIHSCFSEIECFLMPHPGLKASTTHDFDGKLEDIREEFKDKLEELMESLFSPDYLVEKIDIDGILTATDLCDFFQNCETIFNSNEIPLLESIYKVNGHCDNSVACSRAQKYYKSEMEKICKDKYFIFYESMEKEHKVIKNKAIEIFFTMKKMGGKEMEDLYEEHLIEELETIFNHLWKDNFVRTAKRTLLAAFYTAMHYPVFLLIQWFGDQHRRSSMV